MIKNDKNLLKTPVVKENNISAWAQYSILVPTKKIRDEIVEYLKKNKINVAIFYPSPLHTQKCFSYLECKKGDLPVTESVCDTIFNLPCYAEITIEEQDYIIDLIYKVFTSFESQTFF